MRYLIPGESGYQEITAVRALSLFVLESRSFFKTSDECIRAWGSVHEAEHGEADRFREMRKRAEDACGARVLFEPGAPSPTMQP